MASRISYCFFILTLIGGCVHQPQPFQIALAGYDIQFPITVSDLRASHTDLKESLSAFLTKTSPESEVTWRFKFSVNDPRSQPYGVLITLKNKADKIDSIRTFIENKYHLSFEPLKEPKHLGKYEYYEPDSTLRIMQVNKDVQLAISRKKVWPDGKYQFTDDVVIYISYNLSEIEKERFVLKQGEIRALD
ncbi:hypothetical protein [Telluribacter sp. SYSU D00476]|uniref:hypothetical protein n=1 Tax=Telluribacter sp. SYSU D00476 TaxID=2811430 RepID=UPI001FF64CED|nr:hypothetical protein [Telluribacter sp. SYSU D00476]